MQKRQTGRRKHAHAEEKTYSENVLHINIRSGQVVDKTWQMQCFPDQSISDILDLGLLQSPVTIRE